MSFPFQLSSFTRKQLYRWLNAAYASGSLKLVQRLHALLAWAQGQRVCDVAEMWSLGAPTVRDYRHQYLCKGTASLVYTSPPGRPSTLTTTPRQPLAAWIKASPQDAGYPSGGWKTPMMQALIQRPCGVAYYPHSLATWLKNRGVSDQKARFVSDPLNEATRLEWRHTRWPKMLRPARRTKALLLCGAEARCAQWGALRDPWAPKGQQPEVPTSGKRQGDKIFGLIDDFSGQLFYKSHPGRLNSESDAAFLLDVLSQTQKQVIVIQDGARYHTSQAMKQFFETQADRLTLEQLPAYSPDFHPSEHLGKKVTKEATHRKYFPAFTDLQQEVDRALLHLAQTPSESTVLIARYCEKLGQVDKAA